MYSGGSQIYDLKLHSIPLYLYFLQRMNVQKGELLKQLVLVSGIGQHLSGLQFIFSDHSEDNDDNSKA